MKKHNYILLLPSECIKYQLLYYCFKLLKKQMNEGIAE